MTAAAGRLLSVVFECADPDEEGRFWEAALGWVRHHGDAGWVSWKKTGKTHWYGIQVFFDWLETKAYKMHIRVLLSKYRAYTPCETCGGARLKPEALLWRLGTRADSDRVQAQAQRFRPRGVTMSDRQFAALPGLSIHDLVLLPIDRFVIGDETRFLQLRQAVPESFA